jgi:hypothetical protein
MPSRVSSALVARGTTAVWVLDSSWRDSASQKGLAQPFSHSASGRPPPFVPLPITGKPCLDRVDTNWQTPLAKGRGKGGRAWIGLWSIALCRCCWRARAIHCDEDEPYLCDMRWDPYHPVRVVRMSYLDSARGTHTHTHTHTHNHIFQFGRVCRKQSPIEFTPGRAILSGTRGGFFFPGSVLATTTRDHHQTRVPPPPPLKSDFPYPGQDLDRRTVEFGRGRPPPPNLQSSGGRGVGVAAITVLLLLGLARAISWRSMPANRPC